MGKSFNRIIDPRGVQDRQVIKLAPRIGIEKLKEGKILFYNNERLNFCSYMTVFNRIKERFAEVGIAEFVDYTEKIGGKTTKDLEAYAAMLAEEKPSAAILALGDMGTSASTTVLAIELEKLGIPTVHMTAPPGSVIADGVGVYRAGNLCLCSVDIDQTSTVQEIAEQIDLKWDTILSSLTKNGRELDELARINFDMDRVAPAKDGFLPITDTLIPKEDKLLEPGAYLEEIYDYFNKEHISDGLPFIPPTQARYEKMMTYCPFDENQVLCVKVGPSGKNITVKDVAVAAIMAGCKPTAMPVLVATFKALSNPLYNFSQSVTTAHPGGNLVLVSGPIAQEIGLSGKQGCMGPGWPVNATIGRAVNLVIMNVCRAVPGVCDVDCLASQAQFTFCFCEEPSLARWSMINEERFDANTTTVYLLKAEPQHDIVDSLSMDGYDLLDTITYSCTTLGSNNACIPGPLVVCLTPDHGKILKQSGFTKQMIREYIHTGATHEAPMLRNRGVIPIRPASFKHRNPVPVTRTPNDVEVVVIGGRGTHSGVILPWAMYSEGCVEPVALPNGKNAKSIEEFRR